jgi:hypothetical protein
VALVDWYQVFADAVVAPDLVHRLLHNDVLNIKITETEGGAARPAVNAHGAVLPLRSARTCARLVITSPRYS